MKTKLSFTLGLAVLATTAFTLSVSYDPDNGGFAGKGDVKDALGLTEAQIRAQAASLNFTYEDQVEYDVPCMKDNGRQVLRNSFNRSRSVSATVLYEARKNGQGILNGFNLSPASDGTVTGEIACPGGWTADGDPVFVGSTGGGLFVDGVALPNTL